MHLLSSRMLDLSSHFSLLPSYSSPPRRVLPIGLPVRGVILLLVIWSSEEPLFTQHSLDDGGLLSSCLYSPLVVFFVNSTAIGSNIPIFPPYYFCRLSG
jgi:hypothetical protein